MTTPATPAPLPSAHGASIYAISGRSGNSAPSARAVVLDDGKAVTFDRNETCVKLRMPLRMRDPHVWIKGGVSTGLLVPAPVRTEAEARPRALRTSAFSISISS